MNLSKDQRKLVADFLINIGVAWFAGGVIGIFLGGSKEAFEILSSLLWGIVLSNIFLWAGVYLIKEKR